MGPNIGMSIVSFAKKQMQLHSQERNSPIFKRNIFSAYISIRIWDSRSRTRLHLWWLVLFSGHKRPSCSPQGCSIAEQTSKLFFSKPWSSLVAAMAASRLLFCPTWGTYCKLGICNGYVQFCNEIIRIPLKTCRLPPIRRFAEAVNKAETISYERYGQSFHKRIDCSYRKCGNFSSRLAVT